ncbi:MAG: tryptophan 2,3-dioxygenase family protein [Oligoflexia bacterium]|nr:tryptophan 2,3-dioxygenase family protein [Oligoflexia bacterium]
MAVTYSSYLKINELLNLQVPLSEKEHDETLFIVIHQVYELWFKQVLHETAYLQQSLEAGKTPESLATLKRILSILKTMVGQIDVLETMTPLSFASFRARLDTASGFQSIQFRQLEITLGKRNKSALERYAGEPEVKKLLEDISNKPSVYDSFLRYLKLKGLNIPDTVLKRDLSEATMASLEVQKILLNIYRNNPSITQICERLVDLDEGIQEWRYRHVKMVERTIGVKMGTGGSPGAQYLKTTLSQPLFPDLWDIRSEF